MYDIIRIEYSRRHALDGKSSSFLTSRGYWGGVSTASSVLEFHQKQQQQQQQKRIKNCVHTSPRGYNSRLHPGDYGYQEQRLVANGFPKPLMVMDDRWRQRNRAEISIF